MAQVRDGRWTAFIVVGGVFISIFTFIIGSWALVDYMFRRQDPKTVSEVIEETYADSTSVNVAYFRSVSTGRCFSVMIFNGKPISHIDIPSCEAAGDVKWHDID
jgi:hypothetical protein